MSQNVQVKIKISPLNYFHRSHSAVMTNFSGWKLPLYYTGIIQEHNHVRKYAGLFDISHMGRIKINLESITILERHIPSDISGMKIGQVRYSVLINKLGNLVDDLLVYRLKESILLVVNASRLKEVLRNLLEISGLLFKELKNTVQISIQGPKSQNIIKKVFEEPIKLKFMNVEEYNCKKFKFIISRTGYTGEDGFEIIGNKEGISSIILLFLKSQELKPIGLGARDSLRLEAGLCLYGNEIAESINPIEAKISWVLDKKRMKLGNFCGANLFKNILKNGPKIRRYGFIITEKYIARNGAKVKNESGVIRGYISSGCFSPTLNKSICMGFIDSQWDKTEELFVKIRNKLIKIKKIDLPFVKHKYHN